MRLNREEITARIPHAGRMVMLDEVSEWDRDSIVCRTAMHHDRGNPLLVGGHLSSVCAIEFAAQAMAVHGSLVLDHDAQRRAGFTASGRNALTMKPRAGFIASVRDVRLAVARIDDVRGLLTIEATRQSGDEARVLYEFTVSAGESVLVSGRAAVVLQVDEPSAGSIA